MSELSRLSSRYAIRALAPGDLEAVYALCAENELFYRFHPPFVTRQSILDDWKALPPGKTAEDKFELGFWSGPRLIAVLDLIRGYPAGDTAWIGFFMVCAGEQGRGVGSGIVSELAEALRALGFRRIGLGTDRENPQSNAFWQKNGFPLVGERGGFLLRERLL